MRGIETAFWGVLGKDPELKTSKTGKAFATMNVVVTVGQSATKTSASGFALPASARLRAHRRKLRERRSRLLRRQFDTEHLERQDNRRDKDRLKRRGVHSDEGGGYRQEPASPGKRTRDRPCIVCGTGTERKAASARA